MKLDSIGPLAHLEVFQDAADGNYKAGISQDYIGEEEMDLDVSMKGWVPPVEEEVKWLECCYAGEAEEALERSLTPSQSYFISPN
jgi:hypothetical protein